MIKTVRAIRFLFVGPMILLMLLVINVMTSPGVWWVQWPALGIGIAWFVSLFRVMRAALLLGGLTALGVFLTRRLGGHSGGVWPKV